MIFSRISSDPCLKSRGSNPHCGLKGHAQSEPCCLIWGESPSLSKCCHAQFYLFPCAKLLPADEQSPLCHVDSHPPSCLSVNVASWGRLLMSLLIKSPSIYTLAFIRVANSLIHTLLRLRSAPQLASERRESRHPVGVLHLHCHLSAKHLLVSVTIMAHERTAWNRPCPEGVSKGNSLRPFILFTYYSFNPQGNRYRSQSAVSCEMTGWWLQLAASPTHSVYTTVTMPVGL